MTEIKCYCGHTDYCDCGPLLDLTATQWLFEKLWDTPKDKFEWYAILKEAEEKFQHQIEDAYETSHISMMTSKQYYDEKFGKIHAE